MSMHSGRNMPSRDFSSPTTRWWSRRTGSRSVDGTPNDEGTGNIEGVLAPEYGEPAFAEYLASDPLLNYTMCDALPERLQLDYDCWWEVQPPEEEVAA